MFVAFLQAYYEWLETMGAQVWSGKVLATTSTTVVLPAGTVANYINAYQNMYIVCLNGPAKGQTQKISTYNPVSRLVTLVGTWNELNIPPANTLMEIRDSYSPEKLLEYKDIDYTLDRFVKYFKDEFMYLIPGNIKAKPQEVLKHIKQFYQAKGTENSYRFLFRLLFNEEIEFYYPKVDLFRASDAIWYTQKVIKTTTSDLTFDYANRLLTGVASGATAKVESVTQQIYPEGTITTMTLSSIIGQFGIDPATGDPEQVKIMYGVNPPAQTDLGSITDLEESYNQLRYESAYQVLNALAIAQPGQNYQVGEMITISGGGELSPATAVVASIFVTYFTGNCQTPPSVWYLEPFFGPAQTVNTDGNPMDDGVCIPGMYFFSDVHSSYTNADLLNPNQITLGANEVSTDNFFVGDPITLVGGTGLGESAIIVSYNGTTKVATVDKAFTVVPDGTTQYSITHNRGGIKSINIVDFGLGFVSTPTVTIQTALGSGAVLPPALGIVATTPGQWAPGRLGGIGGFPTSPDSMPSTNKIIQDSYYWQEFSYDLRLGETVDKYQAAVKALLHPASMMMFGTVLLKTNLPTNFYNIIRSTILYLNSYKFSLPPNMIWENETYTGYGPATTLQSIYGVTNIRPVGSPKLQFGTSKISSLAPANVITTFGVLPTTITAPQYVFTEQYQIPRYVDPITNITSPLNPAQWVTYWKAYYTYLETSTFDLRLHVASEDELEGEHNTLVLLSDNNTLGTRNEDLELQMFTAFPPDVQWNSIYPYPNENYFSFGNTQLGSFTYQTVVLRSLQNQFGTASISSNNPSSDVTNLSNAPSTIVIGQQVVTLPRTLGSFIDFADQRTTINPDTIINISADSDVPLVGPLVVQGIDAGINYFTNGTIPLTGSEVQYNFEPGTNAARVYNISPNNIGQFDAHNSGGLYVTAGLQFSNPNTSQSVDATNDIGTYFSGQLPIPVHLDQCTVIVVAATPDITKDMSIVNCIQSSNDNGFSIDVVESGLWFRVQNGGQAEIIQFPSGSIKNNAYFMAALRFEDGVLQGNLSSSSTMYGVFPYYPGNPTSNSSGWYLGESSVQYTLVPRTASLYSKALYGMNVFDQSAIAGGNVTVGFFNGTLSYALFYDRALLDYEVQSVFASLQETLIGRGIFLNGITDRAQFGVTNIRRTTIQSNLGVGNLVKYRWDKVTSGLSRLQKSSAYSLLGVTKIRGNKLQLGIARVGFVGEIKNQIGLFLVQNTSVRAIAGRYRIYGTTQQVQSGVTSLVYVTNRTAFGISRFQFTTPQSQMSVSRITGHTAWSMVGKANLASQTNQTYIGITRIQIPAEQYNQNGVSRIYGTTKQPQTGVTNIVKALTTKTQNGVSRIYNTTQQVQLGKSNLYNLTFQVQNGVANIYNLTVQTQLGVSRIRITTKYSQVGETHITG